eukprot:gene6140-biopygen3211
MGATDGGDGRIDTEMGRMGNGCNPTPIVVSTKQWDPQNIRITHALLGLRLRIPNGETPLDYEMSSTADLAAPEKRCIYNRMLWCLKCQSRSLRTGRSWEGERGDCTVFQMPDLGFSKIMNGAICPDRHSALRPQRSALSRRTPHGVQSSPFAGAVGVGCGENLCIPHLKPRAATSHNHPLYSRCGIVDNMRCAAVGCARPTPMPRVLPVEVPIFLSESRFQDSGNPIKILVFTKKVGMDFQDAEVKDNCIPLKRVGVEMVPKAAEHGISSPPTPRRSPRLAVWLRLGRKSRKGNVTKAGSRDVTGMMEQLSRAAFGADICLPKAARGRPPGPTPNIASALRADIRAPF